MVVLNNGLWNLDSAQETTACECGVRLDSRLNYRLSRTLGKHAHTLSKAYIRPVHLTCKSESVGIHPSILVMPFDLELGYHKPHQT